MHWLGSGRESQEFAGFEICIYVYAYMYMHICIHTYMCIYRVNPSLMYSAI